MRRSVTLEDIAARTGCSTATVSLALRNKPGVSRATREQVIATARELGYDKLSRPTRSAAQDSLDVAVIFRTWSGDRGLRTPLVNGFHSWILTGIQESAVEQGAHVLLATIPVDVENAAISFPERLLAKELDGVVLVGAFRPELVARVRSAVQHRPSPVVLVDSTDPEHILDSVETANFDGGMAAARHLIERGHRRIGWFGARSVWEPNFRLRREGFDRSLREAGIDVAGRFELATDAHDPVEAAMYAIRHSDGPTAFSCCNDHFALAMLKGADRLGLRVPQDISVIGFDDNDNARDSTPPLTTMAVDKAALGRHAMYALTQRISWPDAAPMRMELRPRLIERATVLDRR
jgi:DNA-binding LacI/PurR family transcriptional regulator